MIVFQHFGASNQIFIHTEKQQYYAGEVVRGTVSLAVAGSLNVDSIVLKLSGYEQAEFDYTVSREVRDHSNPNNKTTKTVYETKRASQRNTFFKRRYVLFTMRSTLVGGNFSFPFQFTLDANLPGTFYTGSRHSMTYAASVHFEVGAEVVVPGIFESNIRHSQDILICQPLSRALMQADCYKESKVTFLCCIPKGNVSLAATIDKNAYGPGDVVQVGLIVDNSGSQVDLENFSLRLDRTLELSAHGKSFYDSTTIVKSKCAGVQAGQRAERQMGIQLPMDTEPSTRANLVRCSYNVVVELHVPWSPNVRVSTPVQVFAPVRSTYSVHVQMPPGWAPTVMPMVDLQNLQYQTY
jgi:hypothetical protein